MFGRLKTSLCSCAQNLPCYIGLIRVDPLSVVDFVMDLFFLSDVVLNFFTAYKLDGELPKLCSYFCAGLTRRICSAAGEIVNAHYLIAKRYVRTWLLLDIVASVPIDCAQA